MPEERRSQTLTLEQHRDRHIELHRALDELIADFLVHDERGTRLPGMTTLAELMEWSHAQTLFPSVDAQFFHHAARTIRDAQIQLAAAAIANARGMRHGVPVVVNVLEMLPATLRDQVLEDARVALTAVGRI